MLTNEHDLMKEAIRDKDSLAQEFNEIVAELPHMRVGRLVGPLEQRGIGGVAEMRIGFVGAASKTAEVARRVVTTRRRRISPHRRHGSLRVVEAVDPPGHYDVFVGESV